MSLINEALKRTRDATYQNGATRASDVSQYRFANNAQTTGFGSGTAVTVTILICLVVVGLVVALAWRNIVTAQTARTELVETEQAARIEAPPVPPTPPENKTEPAPAGPEATVPEPQPALTISAASESNAIQSEVTPVPPPEPEPPKLVLQGITSDRNGREALINGYIVRLGDELEGARVVAIETRRVKLQFGDQEILLRMP